MKARISKKILSKVCIVIFMLAFGASEITAQQLQGPRDNAQVYSGVVYGPIDPSDTLWRIASRYKQDTRFTIYQTMMAIYELNRQAFENGNFNTMVNGATLQLPSDRYIARIDPARARAKAEQDDQAFGRRNSVRDPVATDENTPSVDNMKPEVPLVNKDDLSNTQAQLQGQLNSLRQQQQAQFAALKDQVSASIDSVQMLLDENKKLNERLIQIDENSTQLATTLETELQTQIDEQDEKLQQLIDMFKQEEARRIEAESKSILEILSSPIALILMTTGFTLLVLVALAIFLLRKPANQQEAQADKSSTKTEDIIDDDLVIGELDDVDADSNDLMAALENDIQEDDILSDDLEDDEAIASLSDDQLTEGLDLDNNDLLAAVEEDSSDSDLDDMLVPDTDDSSFDALDLSDDVDSGQSNEAEIDLSGIDDDLSDQASEDEPPQGIDLDENGDIDDTTLEQIEQKIVEKDAKLNELADELIDELDAMKDDAEGSEEESKENTSGDSEEIDELTDELLAELGLDDEDTDDKADDEIVSADDLDKLLEESAAQVANEELESKADDDVVAADELDKLLEESAAEVAAEAEDETVAADELDKLLEESAAEVTAEAEDETVAADELDKLLEESAAEQDDEIDIGAEEGIEDALDAESIDDEIEQLLSVDDESDELDDLNGDDIVNLTDENVLEDELPDEEVAALAEELLKELEAEGQNVGPTDIEELDRTTASADDRERKADEQGDELNDMLGDDFSDSLDELERDEPNELVVDSDDLLDDIPSFTSDLSLSDDEASDDDEISLEKDDNILADKKAGNQNIAEPEPEPEIADEAASPEEDFDKDIDLSQAADAEQDVLSALPDLDGWLDEDDAVDGKKGTEGTISPSTDENETAPEELSANNKQPQETDTKKDNVDSKDESDLSALELEDDFDSQLSLGDDDDLMAGLDDLDFDDLLNDLASDEDFLSTNNDNSAAEANDDSQKAAKSESKASDDPLEQAGLDLEALMSDSADSEEIDADDFLDVDDLLRESEAMPEMSDSDLDFNLENSLDKLVPNKADAVDTDNSVDSTQASNLDLAQVYIDMEDFDAARELLEEVIQQGNKEQQSEAVSLLESMAK